MITKLQTNTTNALVVTQGINIKSSCKWANLGHSEIMALFIEKNLIIFMFSQNRNSNTLCKKMFYLY